jgi:hypothetical protein
VKCFPNPTQAQIIAYVHIEKATLQLSSTTAMSSQLISRNDLKIAIESNLTKVIEIYLTSRGDNKKNNGYGKLQIDEHLACPLGK